MKTLICLLLLGLLGATDDNGGSHWGPISEGCRIGLSTDKLVYEFGESVDVSALVENVDRDKLEVEGSQARFPYEIELYGPNSDEVPLTLWGKQLMKSHFGSRAFDSLSRGQIRTDTFSTLNRTFDMTLNGKYILIIHRRVPSDLDPSAWINIDSNTVIFEIKVPKKN
jgi:hypothetical protein